MSAASRKVAAEIRRNTTQVPDDHPASNRPAPAESLTYLRVTAASLIKVKATEWLWYQRIPLGALTLLLGREGTGKSTFGAWLAARVTRGELDGIYKGIPKSVFYVATEDDWSRTIAPRLIAAEADMERIFKTEVVQDGTQILEQLSLPQHCDLLRDGICKHDVALVFFGLAVTQRDRPGWPDCSQTVQIA